MARITYSGAAGALIGGVTMFALGVAILAGASDESSSWSVPFFLMAGMFVPALIVSVAPSPRRNHVLRVTVICCLTAAVLGVFYRIPELPILLSLPTVLLAQAAELIFQSKR